jgi:hypothetical protein
MKRILITMLLVNTLVVFPQENKTTSSLYWIDAGVGGDNNGLSGQISINYVNKIVIYKIRYIRSQEFDILGSSSPKETMNDFGILFGMTYSRKLIQLSGSGGIGVAKGIRHGDFLYQESSGDFDAFGTQHYEKKTFTRVGLPLEVECSFKPAKSFGIGLGAYANLNKDRSLFGLLFKIQIGKLR